MKTFIVTYESMAFEAESAEAAIARVDDIGGGGNWQAEEVNLDSASPTTVLGQSRFWVLDLPVDGTEHAMPYAADTVGIVDEDTGGVIAYVHSLNAERMLRALRLESSASPTTDVGQSPVVTLSEGKPCEHGLDSLRMTEDGYTRTWHTQIDEEEKTIRAAFNGSEDFGAEGDGHEYLQCRVCLARVEVPGDYEIKWV